MALSEICNTVNAGGNVSVLASDTFTALTEGEPYLFEASVIASGSGTVELFVNSDVTRTNYETSAVQSDGGKSQGVSSGIKATPDGSGDVVVIKGIVCLFGGRPFILAEVVDSGATERCTIQGTVNTSESTITQLRLVASGSIIADGSYIKVFPVSDLATTAEVTVSGGAVATMDTGAFAALTEGKAYLVFMSYLQTGNGGRTTDLFINNDQTASNYRQGRIRAYGTSGNFSTATSIEGSVDGNRAVAFGFISVLNSTPTWAVMHYQENTVAGSIYAINLHNSHHPTESDLTRVQLASRTGSPIDNNSRILIKEFA